MESVGNLRKLVAQASYDGSDVAVQKHNEITRFMNNALSLNGAFFHDRVPTVDVLIYTIRSIQYPSLPPCLYPQLLDLVAMVEFYRLAALDHARSALVWNEHYKKEANKSRNAEIITLAGEEEEFLREMENRHISMRRVYMTIVVNSCKADMYQLLLTFPLSITNYMIRYHEYFPFFSSQVDFKSPLLLHRTLSEAETEQIREAGRECSRWACEGHMWAQDHRMDGQSIEEIFQLNEFGINFPFPDKCRPGDLEVMLDYYLNTVKASVDRLEAMFGLSASD